MADVHQNLQHDEVDQIPLCFSNDNAPKILIFNIGVALLSFSNISHVAITS